jgi:hypothetical protein
MARDRATSDQPELALILRGHGVVDYATAHEMVAEYFFQYREMLLLLMGMNDDQSG